MKAVLFSIIWTFLLVLVIEHVDHVKISTIEYMILYYAMLASERSDNNSKSK